MIWRTLKQWAVNLAAVLCSVWFTYQWRTEPSRTSAYRARWTSAFLIIASYLPYYNKRRHNKTKCYLDDRSRQGWFSYIAIRQLQTITTPLRGLDTPLVVLGFTVNVNQWMVGTEVLPTFLLVYNTSQLAMLIIFSVCVLIWHLNLPDTSWTESDKELWAITQQIVNKK